MLKRIIVPLLFLSFAWFVVSNGDARTIIAGVAIFLIGMHYMENGFKLFSGGALEQFLEKFTSTTPRAIGTGFLATAIVQSSSLVSVIVISFLSAELIGLTQAVGVVFGSNIGTNTTAGLVSSLGLKIKIRLTDVDFWRDHAVFETSYLQRSGQCLNRAGIYFSGNRIYERGLRNPQAGSGPG
jgi:phosphate:Na+ symporter